METKIRVGDCVLTSIFHGHGDDPVYVMHIHKDAVLLCTRYGRIYDWTRHPQKNVHEPALELTSVISHTVRISLQHEVNKRLAATRYKEAVSDALENCPLLSMEAYLTARLSI